MHTYERTNIHTHRNVPVDTYTYTHVSRSLEPQAFKVLGSSASGLLGAFRGFWAVGEGFRRILQGFRAVKGLFRV